MMSVPMIFPSDLISEAVALVNQNNLEIVGMRVTSKGQTSRSRRGAFLFGRYSFPSPKIERKQMDLGYDWNRLLSKGSFYVTKQLDSYFYCISANAGNNVELFLRRD